MYGAGLKCRMDRMRPYRGWYTSITVDEFPVPAVGSAQTRSARPFAMGHCRTKIGWNECRPHALSSKGERDEHCSAE